MEKTIKWQIVKATDTHTYFDCELEKNYETEDAQSFEKFTSWLAVITNVKRSQMYNNRYYQLERTFVDARGLKDFDSDYKYPALHPLIIKGAKLEIGRKKLDRYNSKPERHYNYFEVIEITDTHISVRPITKDNVIKSMLNPDVVKLKTQIIEKITACDTATEVILTLGTWIDIAKKLLEQEEKKIKVTRDS